MEAWSHATPNCVEQVRFRSDTTGKWQFCVFTSPNATIECRVEHGGAIRIKLNAPVVEGSVLLTMLFHATLNTVSAGLDFFLFDGGLSLRCRGFTPLSGCPAAPDFCSSAANTGSMAGTHRLVRCTALCSSKSLAAQFVNRCLGTSEIAPRCAWEEETPDRRIPLLRR